MTYGRVMPELEARLPATERKLKRRRVPIPGLQPEFEPPSRFTDEQVIAAILECLAGRRYADVARPLGTHVNVVRAWCEGKVRRRCLDAAEQRWRLQLAAKGR